MQIGPDAQILAKNVGNGKWKVTVVVGPDSVCQTSDKGSLHLVRIHRTELWLRFRDMPGRKI